MNIVERLEQDELAKGYAPIHPGMAPWFPASDWHPSDCCSTDGQVVRIVAVIARNPGTGAFRRLVGAIRERGMTPIVVEPIFTMPDIMTRWGWQEHVIGEGIHRERWFLPPDCEVSQ